MTVTHLRSFRERLAAALEHARTRGVLDEREYESLLLDPDFDDEEFDRFRVAAARVGLQLPAEPSGVDEPGAEPVRGTPPRERELLDVYLEDIGRIPLLKHEELLSLAARAGHGDETARRRIILANLRLVVHLARAYRHRGLPMLDLIEEGNLGLIHAVDRFEPQRGLRFSTYASIWIRQSMLRGIAEQSRSIRIPVQMFQQVSRFVRAERELRMSRGREPSIGEIAAALDISVVRAERLAALLGGLRSLDEQSSLDAFDQLSEDARIMTPTSVERLVELQLEHERVDRMLRSLSQREEQILRIRYGFFDGESRTLAQTGEHFGITRERVRQIEARALDKLRRAIELQHMDDSAGTRVH
jgi:RNA polymerase primary sigma factor